MTESINIGSTIANVFVSLISCLAEIIRGITVSWEKIDGIS